MCYPLFLVMMSFDSKLALSLFSITCLTLNLVNASLNWVASESTLSSGAS